MNGSFCLLNLLEVMSDVLGEWEAGRWVGWMGDGCGGVEGRLGWAEKDEWIELDFGGTCWALLGRVIPE